ncbi:molybdopterin molybdotransferase MoeA [Cellulomonas alba]|uniref:Molybdopterin molybdenumtransferase n=1 Tax=Cellulomonas alba TaxID=3053467 RepID=A0ABT7SFY1_9CELL|nr:gephyrin-like molybdotransferase Glp [Cellulomonas alba]MDM7855096.1 molybdopterin molybdotransferase MoeA [Cellulomonas alba]
MRTLTEHQDAALALAAPLPPVEVGLADALGLVAAQDVVADAPLPRWDNSAMDGFAVRAADVEPASPDTPVTLRVLDDAPAGAPSSATVEPGTAIRIMTGAPLPAGADAVVPVEQTDAVFPQVTPTVRIRAGVPRAMHVRRAGEDARPGDVVVARGTLIGAPQVGAVASVGRDRLSVHRRPRVAVVATGDELVAPGEPPAHGQLPDSNSWLLAAAVREAGADPVRLGPLPDDPDALLGALARLDDDPTIDAVVTSGGVSAGAFDVVKAALAGTGVEFVAVAVQPGKPQGLGRLPAGTPLFALPGNPVSVYTSFEVFVRPALLRMRGVDVADVRRTEVVATTDDGWRSPAGRAQLMPVRFVAPDRVRRATDGGSGSHLATRLALVEGLAVVPADVDEVAAGDVLRVLRVRT